MGSGRNAGDHLPLAPHVFQILLSLLDEDRHGYSILKDIARRTGGETTLGTSTLYAALRRMVGAGLLTEVEGPPGAESGGPQRQYYRLTALGRRVAREEALRIRRLERMVAGSSLFGALGRAAGQEEGS